MILDGRFGPTSLLGLQGFLQILAELVEELFGGEKKGAISFEDFKVFGQ